MYQNRPIYWLFSSKKGAFKCITYMHRMDAYTAELVRKNYLLKHIDYLAGKIAGLEQDELAFPLGTARNLLAIVKIMRNVSNTTNACSLSPPSRLPSTWMTALW